MYQSARVAPAMTHHGSLERVVRAHLVSAGRNQVQSKLPTLQMQAQMKSRFVNRET